MKKKRKGKLVIIIIVTILAISFIFGVQLIKKHRQDIVGKSYKKTMEDYKTGEILNWENILEKNKLEEDVWCLSIRLNGASDKKYKNDYYIFDNEIINKALEIVKKEKFEVADEWERQEKEKSLYSIQFTMKNRKSIRFSTIAGMWDKQYCNIYQVLEDGFGLSVNSFFREYAEKLFFVSEVLSEFTEDVVYNQIKDITLAQAKQYISEGEADNMVEKFFQHYYTTDGVTDMTAFEVSELDRFELGDEEGYLVMERGMDNQEQGYYTVYCVTFYNEKDEIQEVLYENQEAMERKEKNNESQRNMEGSST